MIKKEKWKHKEHRLIAKIVTRNEGAKRTGSLELYKSELKYMFRDVMAE